MEPTGSPAPGPGPGAVPPSPGPSSPGGAPTGPASGSTASGLGDPSRPGATTISTGPGAPGTGPAARPGSGFTAGEWPAQATNVVVDLVGTVRDKTTGPITTVARGLVFGLFAAVVGGIIGVLAIIAVIRLLDEALPSGVWLPYLILGALFVLAGALVFRKRKAPHPAR